MRIRTVALLFSLLAPAATATATETEFVGELGSLFGQDVAAAGDIAVVGYFHENEAKVYRRTPFSGEWVEEAHLISSGPGLEESRGFRWLATSGDRVVMGVSRLGGGGAVYVFAYDGANWVEEDQLMPSDPSTGDQFGTSVAISGNVIVVGAEATQSAYVFRRFGSSWSQEQKLSCSSNCSQFGQSIAVAGEWMAVGAPASGTVHMYHYDGISSWTVDTPISRSLPPFGSGRFGTSLAMDGPALAVGMPLAEAVYVFNLNGSTWVEGELIQLPIFCNCFGGSVALDLPLLVVGATGVIEGGAHVYRFTGQAWNAEVVHQAPDPFPGPPPPVVNEQFGYSVAVTGETVWAGAHLHEHGGAQFSWFGAAYVFDAPASAKLLASDGARADQFGISVSVHGDVAVVGAQLGESALGYEGSAYVYRWDGTAWNEEAELLASDGAAVDRFGISVSVHGDVAVVGARSGDGALGDEGSAYVYRWDGTAWNEEAELLASDGATGDQFGISVSVHGDVAVVGAQFGDGALGDEGSAYVYRWDGTAWNEEAELLASDGATGDQFAISVSVHGDVAVVGAFSGDGALGDEGSAYVYRWDGTAWNEEAELLASDGAAIDRFGVSVSVHGDVAVVGAQFGDGALGDEGSAYVYRWDGTAWNEEAELLASDGATGDQFAISVSVHGDVAVVGAFSGDGALGDEGSAYVYRWDGTAWNEEAELLASDGAALDEFGISVSVHGDVAVVGARFGDGALGYEGSAYAFGTPIAACADGEDNDGDTLVDLADPGCMDATDRWEREAEQVAVSAGSSQPASALGGSAAPGGVDIVFDTTGGGTFSAEVASLPTAPGQDPSNLFIDPTTIDFYVMGNPAQLWELSYSDPSPGEYETTFGYDEAALTGPETDLIVYHFVDPNWVAIVPDPGDLDTTNNTITIRTSSLSPFLLGVARACSDGIDNDSDGATDGADTGCLDSADPSELPACSDGFDRDYDGWADYPDDPGCQAALSLREAPQCQDGIDNDGQPGTDFDGGESIFGVGNGDPDGPDPNCSSFFDNKEAPNSGGTTCGIGPELVLLTPLLMLAHGRRRRVSA